jgi:hypothetical protein
MFTAGSPLGTQGSIVSNNNNSTITDLQISNSYSFGATQNFLWLCQGTQTIGNISITNVHATTLSSTDVAFQVCSANSLTITGSTEVGFSGLYNAAGTFTIRPYLKGPVAFTPSPACGTATFTVNSARFKADEKIASVVGADFTMTALGTCTTAIGITFTLPVTPAAFGATLIGQEAAVNGKGWVCGVFASTAATTCKPADGSAIVAASRLVVSGNYEIP